MNELALFAGAGGGLLASRLLGWRTVCAVERSKYRQRVLLQRQRDGHLERFPVWDDVRTFDGRQWRGRVDVLTAGFPCQPWSIGAGKQPGPEDERNLWPDTIRIIREVGPGWVMLENASSLLAHDYTRTIFGDLAESGFDAEWDCIPASFLGADHHRSRLWIVAHSSEAGRKGNFGSGLPGTKGAKLHTPRRFTRSTRLAAQRERCTAADVCRKRDGVANWMDRLEAIGDGQVPAVVVRAWQELTAADA